METCRSHVRSVVGAFLTCLFLVGISLAETPRLPRAEPESIGMDAAKLAEIDAIVAEEIAKGQRRRAVVNEQRDGAWMQGEVHDPRSYFTGGGSRGSGSSRPSLP